MNKLPDLPVSEVLEELSDFLKSGNSAILVAPPGAGKTTLVPLHLLSAPWLQNRKIILLEPRRLAARAAARRMAALLGERVGETVGYAMRLDRRESAKTRILVVTEGVYTRMALEDPELIGIGAVVFDEFHERSLDADFGLALTLDIAGALRTDLRLLVLSATLDVGPLSKLLNDAPVVESRGRAYPVDIRYQQRGPGTPIEVAMADAIRGTLIAEDGSILAFLPGQGEIKRTLERLVGRVADNTDLVPLSGGLDSKAQDAAIRPPQEGRRKVVLATSIAESAITIDGIRIVIDSGLSRLPKFEPGTGLTRLETVRVSYASATQRAGRAGRTMPGIAIRLWSEHQTRALPAHAPPEILEADLSGLVLDCASFGVTNPANLSFLDPPPEPALAEARKLLGSLGALAHDGRITATGEKMRQIRLPVRLAHMVAIQKDRCSAERAAQLAMLVTERGLGGNSVDLDERLRRFQSAKDNRSVAARSMAKRLAGVGGSENDARSVEPVATGALLAAAYPDRIASTRGNHGQFVLANGRGASMDEASPLASSQFLVVADLQGKAQNQRIAAAISISKEELFSLEFIKPESRTSLRFDPQTRSLKAEETRFLGAITLSRSPVAVKTGNHCDQALLDAVRQYGLEILPWSDREKNLMKRLQWLHANLGEPWPDFSRKALINSLEDWLAPFLAGEPSFQSLSGSGLKQALLGLVPSTSQVQIDRLAPEKFRTPEGSAITIDYRGADAVLAVRVQLLFGLKNHPAIGDGRFPLTLELLSPAGRPIQTTRDLPGFWAGSWSDVRTEMRGRYPKHVWPDDPASAVATARAKPRK